MAAAVAEATNSTVPITATIQIVRMNLTATRYSTPSGHAAAIVTSEPNRMATPSTEIRRPSHSGPCPVSASAGLTTSVGVVPTDPSTGVVVAPAMVVPVVASVAAAAAAVVVVSTGSVDTLNVMLPEPFGSPSASLTSQLATQVPFGQRGRHGDRDAEVVGADLQASERHQLGVALEADRVGLAQLLGEHDRDLGRRRRDRSIRRRASS